MGRTHRMRILSNGPQTPQGWQDAELALEGLCLHSASGPVCANEMNFYQRMATGEVVDSLTMKNSHSVLALDGVAAKQGGHSIVSRIKHPTAFFQTVGVLVVMWKGAYFNFLTVKPLQPEPHLPVLPASFICSQVSTSFPCPSFRRRERPLSGQGEVLSRHPRARNHRRHGR